MLQRLLTPLQVAVTIVMFFEVAAIMGIALYPGVSLVLWGMEHLAPSPYKVLLLCMFGAFG